MSKRSNLAPFFIISGWLLLTWVGAAAGVTADPHASFRPGQQEILFGDTVDGSTDIWAINADGTERNNLSRVEHDPDSIYEEGSARWSPDGRQILFVSNKTGVGRKAFLMDPDGRNVRPATPNSDFENDPSWGADGDRIYYAKNTRFPLGGSGCEPCPFWEIYEYELSSGFETRLTFNESRDEHPVASPDGTSIAFAHAERPLDCCNPRDVWLMDSNGSSQQALTDVNGRYETPIDWDPNTNRLLTTWQIGCGQSRCKEVVLMDPSGGHEQLTFNNVAEDGIAFSPDGSTILLSRQGDILFLDVVTRAATSFLDAPHSLAPFDWREIPNQRPEAICIDVEASADSTCLATATVDGGSFDPDGDPITLSQEPPGPYPLGSTLVELAVEDGSGASASCSAIVVVVDREEPAIACNAPAVIPEPEGVLVFEPTAIDSCGAAEVSLGDLSCEGDCEAEISGRSIVLGEVDEGSVVSWVVTATDESGNVSQSACRVAVVEEEDEEADGDSDGDGDSDSD